MVFIVCWSILTLHFHLSYGVRSQDPQINVQFVVLICSLISSSSLILLDLPVIALGPQDRIFIFFNNFEFLNQSCKDFYIHLYYLTLEGFSVGLLGLCSSHKSGMTFLQNFINIIEVVIFIRFFPKLVKHIITVKL